jgi:hypothetical protein
MAMDMFYQGYAPRDAFFDQDDFLRHFATVYSDMLNDMMQKMRRDNKQIEGFANIENSAHWLVREKLTPKKNNDDCWVTKPSSDIFSFMFDSFGYGLDQIQAVGNCGNGTKCRVVRIAPYEAVNLDLAPITSLVYAWLTPENEIHLTKGVDIEIWYVPAVNVDNGECVISEAIVHRAIKQTLDLFFTARNGTVIDETNDGNRNTPIQQQVNPTLQSQTR